MNRGIKVKHTYCVNDGSVNVDVHGYFVTFSLHQYPESRPQKETRPCMRTAQIL